MLIQSHIKAEVGSCVNFCCHHDSFTTWAGPMHKPLWRIPPQKCKAFLFSAAFTLWDWSPLLLMLTVGESERLRSDVDAIISG